MKGGLRILSMMTGLLAFSSSLRAQEQVPPGAIPHWVGPMPFSLEYAVANLWVVAPVAAMVLVGVVVMLVGAFWPGSNRAAVPWIGVIGLAGTAWVTVWAASAGRPPIGMQVLDGFTVVFDLIVLAATAAAILISPAYVNREEMARGEYYSLMILSAAGAMLMAAADNLIMLFLGLELLSIPLYVLAGFARTQADSEEAGLKYFLLGSFASAFLVFGSGLVYATLGTTTIGEIAAVLVQFGDMPFSALLVIGMALVLVAMAFKVGLVPFHMWTPDVYQGAPTSVTAFMAVIAKAAGFAAIVRIAALGLQHEQWNGLLWGLSAATMIWGNLLAVSQQNIKRLLAYSSIAHAGYLMMGILAGSVEGFSSLLFYLGAYAAMTLGAFAVVMQLSGRGDAYENLSDYRGVARRNPLLAYAMAAFMLSMAGIPPFAGFFAKLYLFLAALQQGYIGLTVLAVLTSAIGVYYYLRVTVVMFMEEPSAAAEDVPALRMPALSGFMVTLLALITVGLGLFSTPVREWTDAGAMSALRSSLPVPAAPPAAVMPEGPLELPAAEAAPAAPEAPAAPPAPTEPVPPAPAAPPASPTEPAAPAAPVGP